jgi:hypothetical protein
MNSLVGRQGETIQQGGSQNNSGRDHHQQAQPKSPVRFEG